MNDVAFLLADEKGRRYGFGRSFLGFLMRDAKQRSIGGLLTIFRQPVIPSTFIRLKRLSAGKTLPDQAQVKIIIRRCCVEEEDSIMNMHWVMRY